MVALTVDHRRPVNLREAIGYRRRRSAAKDELFWDAASIALSAGHQWRRSLFAW